MWVDPAAGSEFRLLHLRSRVARAPRTIATVLYLVVHAACTDVTGGAVELSWRLRPGSGTSTTQPLINCDTGFPGTGPVTGVLLSWNVEGKLGSVTFNCDANHGVTRFVVPPGTALLSVSPVCASGPAAPDTYIAPAPEQRTVNVGDTVSLGAVELVLQVTACSPAQPCICQ
ncbi:MAG: hypothetical protein JO257_18065 [Deltaproteobacteria bacterium]|nr:hypothetical protein [Deltaproteobacteria bacterium]